MTAWTFMPRSNKFRILDYKTGDSGKGPDEKHRRKDKSSGKWQWTELQLPLYRHLLLSVPGVDAAQLPVEEMGYILLSADLRLIDKASETKPVSTREAGIGLSRTGWGQADLDDALKCARRVIQNVRNGVFWPPTDPPPFPPSRTDPGRADVYSGLCLNSCSDRREWFGTPQEELN